VKSSSAFDGLELLRLAIDFALPGLARGDARGDAATLLIVLFAGLAWLD
jgi:hypothetical protein